MDGRTLRRLSIVWRNGLRGLWATPLVSAVSVSTMTAGLLVLGAYLLIVGNMRDVLEQFGSDLRLVAFASDGQSLDVQQAARLAANLGAIDGVADVRFVPPSQALERLRGELGRDAAILKGLERNPLPGSFELEIEASSRSPARLGAIAALARKLSGISEVRYGEAWVDSYARVVRIVEWVGLGLGIFLVVVLGAIVAGTVRLTVHARSDEIQIQQLVGAGGFFIRLRFYLEGALHGGTAASLAILLLYAFWVVGLPIFGEPLEFLRGPVPLEFFGSGQVLTLLLFGVGLGIAGAVVTLLRLPERP